MSYAVELRPTARRQLRRLPNDVRQRVGSRINAFTAEPRPPGARRMHGPVGHYRIRVGDYRVVYDIDDRAALVAVLAIGHRSDVYR